MAQAVKLGLALGSGGARGLAHAGVLEVLERAGIKPDVISGTSMGAIVGGLYAEQPDARETWSRLQSYVQDEEFTSSWSAFVARDSLSEEAAHTGRFQDLMDFVQRKIIALKTVTRPYAQDASRLRGPLENLFRKRTFEELQIPFAAMGLDLISGHGVVFKSGLLIDGIYASSAIPAIFPPLERDGMMICDGGGPFRVPVEACHGLGADIVIAVDIPAFEEQKFSTGLDMILRANTIARQRLNSFVLASADMVIHPDVHDIHWADFRASKVCHARGVEAAQSALPQLDFLLHRRRSWSFRMRRQLVEMLGGVAERQPVSVD